MSWSRNKVPQRKHVTNKSKGKGTAWETAIKNWLAGFGYKARRIALHGANDIGDLEIEGFDWLVIEAKNTVKMELSVWIEEVIKEADNAGAEVGVVWHHRPRRGSPADAYVTMTGEHFFKLLRRLEIPGTL
jgi:hypothetical protein